VGTGERLRPRRLERRSGYRPGGLHWDGSADSADVEGTGSGGPPSRAVASIRPADGSRLRRRAALRLVPQPNLRGGWAVQHVRVPDARSRAGFGEPEIRQKAGRWRSDCLREESPLSSLPSCSQRTTVESVDQCQRALASSEQSGHRGCIGRVLSQWSVAGAKYSSAETLTLADCGSSTGCARRLRVRGRSELGGRLRVQRPIRAPGRPAEDGRRRCPGRFGR
jgi:hypothetical protein